MELSAQDKAEVAASKYVHVCEWSLTLAKMPWKPPEIVWREEFKLPSVGVGTASPSGVRLLWYLSI